MSLSVVLALLVSADLLALVRSVVCALLASVPWTLVLGTLIRYHVAFMMSTPLQNFFSAPQHTMRSPHYHCATRSAHIAISIRAIHPRGRQLNRYRQPENDLKKVCGKPSARKHGGRSYNIGANNGSKRGHTHARGRAQRAARTVSTATRGHTAARAHTHTESGQARQAPRGRRTKKSTVDQASAGAHTGKHSEHT